MKIQNIILAGAAILLGTHLYADREVWPGEKDRAYWTSPKPEQAAAKAEAIFDQGPSPEAQELYVRRTELERNAEHAYAQVGKAQTKREVFKGLRIGTLTAGAILFPAGVIAAAAGAAAAGAVLIPVGALLILSFIGWTQAITSSRQEEAEAVANNNRAVREYENNERDIEYLKNEPGF